MDADTAGNFEIRAGIGVGITTETNGIRIAYTGGITTYTNTDGNLDIDNANFTIDLANDIAISGDMVIAGDLTVNGTYYTVHAEHVYTEDDYIIMRDGAVTGLGSGDYSGFQVKLYDGVNDGRLVIDNAGVARVGDVGDEQPLMTRDESADLDDGGLLKWDAANSKAISEGTVGNDTKPIKIVNGVAQAVAYSLVDTATTQTIYGDKFFNGNITNALSFNAFRNLSTGIPAADEVRPVYTFYNSDGTVRQANLYLQKDTSGVLSLNIELRKNDGTYKYVRIADSS